MLCKWFPEGSNLAPAVLHAAALPDELENHPSGCSESNAVSPGPRPGGAPHPLHPVSGPPRIRTENFLVAGQALFQLELAAHWVPSSNEGTRRATGLVPGAHTSVPGGLRRSWCSAVELSMLRHIHPKVVLRRDGASRTRIPPVLETGSLAAGSSLCIRKAARQVSLRAAPGRNWFVPIQKPPASPECPSVARTRVCRHTFRLAGDRLPRVSRVFLPLGVLPVIESTCGQ